MGVFNKERQLTPSWDLLQPSIDLVKKYFWQVVYLAFVPGLVMFIGITLLGEDITKTPDNRLALGSLFTVVGAIWAILAYPGFLYMQTKALDGTEISAAEAFRKGLPRLFPLLGMAIVGGLLIVLGLIALIVPGLLLLRGFTLASYYVIDKKLGPIQALRASYQDSVPVSAWIWGLIGVQVVIAILASVLGRLPLIGFLISLAVGYIYVFAPAIRYAEITKKFKPGAPAKS